MPQDPIEPDLVQIMQGSAVETERHEAWRSWFEPRKDKLAAYLRNRWRFDAMTIEDVLAEVEHISYVGLRTGPYFTGVRGSLDQYVLGIAHHLAIRCITRRPPTIGFDDIPDIEHCLALADDHHIDSFIDQDLARDSAEKMLAGLKPRSREIVQLKFSEGLSYREIGDRMGLTAGNVRTIFCRALRTCRHQAAELGLMQPVP